MFLDVNIVIYVMYGYGVEMNHPLANQDATEKMFGAEHLVKSHARIQLRK